MAIPPQTPSQVRPITPPASGHQNASVPPSTPTRPSGVQNPIKTPHHNHSQRARRQPSVNHVEEQLRTVHPTRHLKSYKLLWQARDVAREDPVLKYDYEKARQVMIQECKRAAGLTPYPEQLDLAECLILGIDCTAVAPTGWGKTLPFALPLFYFKTVPSLKKKIIIIQSPLNVLEVDQVSTRKLRT